MDAHRGEKARETGDFRCSNCHSQMHVTRGEKIPRCPDYGKGIFDTRYHESGKKLT